jgi:hypothetical protein
MSDAKAETKKPADVIELIAVERGFAMGRMLEPGTKFLFRTTGRDGKARALPRWAQPADQPLPKKQATSPDLKPKGAQAAVMGKAAVLAGNTPPEPGAKAPDPLA